jgi:hypothetical protein
MPRVRVFALLTLVAVLFALSVGARPEALQNTVMNLCPGAGVCLGTGNVQSLELWTDGQARARVSPAGEITFLGAVALPGGSSIPFASVTATPTTLAGYGITDADPKYRTVVTSTSTGAVDNFAPALVGHTIVRLNNATDLALTGMAGGVSGQLVTFVSIGAGNVTMAYNSSSSTAGNKFLNYITSGVTPLVAGSGKATYLYDGTTLAWRLVNYDMGGWLTPAFAAGNFTGANSQTWTVEGADVTTNQYTLVGRTISWNLRILTTTVGGTPDPNLQVAMPNGYTGAHDVYMPAYAGQAASSTGLFGIFTGFNKLSILRTFDAANWASGTNNTQVNGTLTAAVQ